jgi:predicted 3-demethylubiquinone-9 3-methyltransferase (glyoxalase superfamily)
MADLTLTPFLMFQEGKASGAIDYYLATFRDARLEGLERFAAGEQGAEGTVKAATLVIAGQKLRVFDSPVKHAFDFTPAISFFIDCTSEEQLRALTEKLMDGGASLMPLNNYGFSQLFAWVNDRFGVSWQLNLP